MAVSCPICGNRDLLACKCNLSCEQLSDALRNVAERTMLVTGRIRRFCTQHSLHSSTASFIHECLATGAVVRGPWVAKDIDLGGSCLFGSEWEATEVVTLINWARDVLSK